MKPHVLIVDDSLTVRMDLRAVLHEAGFGVTACDTKSSAQKALRSRSFSLVILDVMLPDGSGIDLLKEIRADVDAASTPVIMLSSEAEVKHRVRGLSMGADQYVGKPYDSAYIARCARFLLSGQSSQRMTPVPGSEVALTGYKILVVDDSPTYQEALAAFLRQDKHEVVLASSGEEALELLAVEPVDAIILDLLMPGIGGLETCRRIREDMARRSIPIMMLTGRDDRETRAQGLAAGVDEYVVKSPELEQLKHRLRALLRKRRAEPEPRPAEERSSRSSGMWGKQAEVPRDSLLYRVVTESGLSNVIGPTTIARACKRVGVDARTMTPHDLKRALPAIQETLRLFLTQEETEVRMRAIAGLVREAL